MPDPTHAPRESFAAGSHLLLDVRLVPHRSLGPSQFRLLMGVFALVATVSSLPFVIAGAWPVGGFMGLDIRARLPGVPREFPGGAGL